MLSHHAYYIEDSLAHFNDYRMHLREASAFAAHDPGFVARRYESFGIDEARELSVQASLRLSGARQFFFIAAASMTSEAQQALLKLFEEPQEGTQFVLLVPHGALLPTLLSRCLAYPKAEEKYSSQASPRRPAASEEHFSAAAFLSWPYKKRSEWVAELLDADSEEDAGVRERVRDALGEIETALAARLPGDASVRDGLADIAHVRQYLADRSPSLKMILEHLAVTLPTYA